MKVLLTGASGFVGSHILDRLCQEKVATAVLLRNSSDKRFLQQHLARIEVRFGSVTDAASLPEAMGDITDIIHCAGRTKAVRNSEFYEVNQLGTRNVVEAANTQERAIRRFVHISSLAVSGPATELNPANEDTPPQPVSEYGKSKLAAELQVREHCRIPFTIIRPPVVYGPRDSGVFSMFKAVGRHVLPRPKKNQSLSVVYARDLAEAVVKCLQVSETAGKTYFAASPEIVTSRGIAEEIAAQMKRWTIPVPIPGPLLWVVCLIQQMMSQVTRQPSLLNLQKYSELRAPGWVCDASKLQREAGFICRTGLKAGIAETLDWYIRERWL